MSHVTRRDALKVFGAATLSSAAGFGAARPARAAGELKYQPEKGAALRLLRWKRFVQGDEDQWMANTRKFIEATGVVVDVESVGPGEVTPKAALAASVGAGPDIVYGAFDAPRLYPDKCLELTELAHYLGDKYGGWYDVCTRYCIADGRWIAIAMAFITECVVYRRSMVQEAGFADIPQDLPGFLKLCKALKAKRTPAGLALGNAGGDANTWCHWLIWAHGGKMVTEKNEVAINSKETLAALEYARELYPTFIPGTLSWLDPNNNKAFLAGETSLTYNGMSIYYAAKTSEDPSVKALAADIFHAHLPIGPVNRPTELAVFTPAWVFKYTKYPNAAREYLRFMLEREQYAPWLQASMGYLTQPLTEYESNPVWAEDPKHTPFRDGGRLTLDTGYAGRLGHASAACLSDFILVNMVAEVAAGQSTPKAAAARAEQRARRYYKAPV